MQDGCALIEYALGGLVDYTVKARPTNLEWRRYACRTYIIYIYIYIYIYSSHTPAVRCHDNQSMFTRHLRTLCLRNLPSSTSRSVSYTRSQLHGHRDLVDGRLDLQRCPRLDDAGAIVDYVTRIHDLQRRTMLCMVAATSRSQAAQVRWHRHRNLHEAVSRCHRMFGRLTRDLHPQFEQCKFTHQLLSSLITSGAAILQCCMLAFCMLSSGWTGPLQLNYYCHVVSSF